MRRLLSLPLVLLAVPASAHAAAPPLVAGPASVKGYDMRLYTAGSVLHAQFRAKVEKVKIVHDFELGKVKVTLSKGKGAIRGSFGAYGSIKMAIAGMPKRFPSSNCASIAHTARAGRMAGRLHLKLHDEFFKTLDFTKLSVRDLCPFPAITQPRPTGQQITADDEPLELTVHRKGTAAPAWEVTYSKGRLTSTITETGGSFTNADDLTAADAEIAGTAFTGALHYTSVGKTGRDTFSKGTLTGDLKIKSDPVGELTFSPGSAQLDDFDTSAGGSD